MTIYKENVSWDNNIYEHKYEDTTSRMTGFFKLMVRWKASFIKLMYHDLIIFLLLYYFMSFLYRYVLMEHPHHREWFELICVYAGRNMNKIPLNFLIGFYVQQVVTRWWSMFTSLPYPDRIALKLISYCPGKVRDRFPDLDSLVESKLLLPHEAERLQRVDFTTPHEATWTPILWALKLVCKARERAEVTLEPPVYADLVKSFENIEEYNRKILNFGWQEFPLAYTQVATFSVYLYFGAALLGRQFLDPGNMQNTETFPHITVPFSTEEPFISHTPDVYIPLFTIIEFISYMGWIKVAETLLNPFGDDDEDFDINYLIDRNLQVSYLIVDLADADMELANDPFLEAGISIPEELPYQNLSSRASSVRSIIRKQSVSLVNIKNAFAAAEAGVGTPRLERKDISRELSRETINNGSPFVGRRLDDLMEVDNEQDTIRSLRELKRREQQESKDDEGGTDNASFSL